MNYFVFSGRPATAYLGQMNLGLHSCYISVTSHTAGIKAPNTFPVSGLKEFVPAKPDGVTNVPAVSL